MPATQSAAAPGRLEVVRRFVNTCDIEAGNDTLATPEACLRWLRGQDLLDRSVDTLDRADRDEVVAFRESLRDVLGVHRNGRLGDAVLDRLNATAAHVGLAVRFTPSGSWQVHARGDGVHQAVGRLLTIVIGAMADGTWSRMKVCANDACRWAFYDRSKARSRRWCSMRICGNRAKQHAWRSRDGGKTR